MKLFAITLGVVCIVAIALFGVVFALLLLFWERSEAAQLAAAFIWLPILALPAIAEFLERRTDRTRLADYREFQIPWPVMVAYALLVLIALDFASSILIVMLAAPLPSEGGELFDETFFQRLFLLALAIQLPVMMLDAYLVARWIGGRCPSRGLLGLLFALFLLAAVIIGDTELLTPVERYHPVILPLNLIQLALILLSALVGYWRGRAGRWSRYMHYLLGVTPPATRDAVVELAFEEARKATVSSSFS
jgi:hypothetical protein